MSLAFGDYFVESLLYESLNSLIYCVKRDGIFYTLKKVILNQDSENEVDILRKLSFRYVIHFHEALMTKTHCFIVSEYCPHGDLGHIIKIARENKLLIDQRVLIINYKSLDYTKVFITFIIRFGLCTQ